MPGGETCDGDEVRPASTNNILEGVPECTGLVGVELDH
jgi:hypothetical protein